MFEDDLRLKGRIEASPELDAAVLRYARARIARRQPSLRRRLVRRALPYVPFSDWVLMIRAFLRGESVRIRPVLPGMGLFKRGLTLGDS